MDLQVGDTALKRRDSSHLCQKFVKAMSLDKLPYSPYGVKIEKDIVYRIQYRRQDLVRNKQMSEVCTRVCAANRASALGVDRS